MTPKTFKETRNALGLTQRGLARLFRMGKHGWRNVQRWEAGVQDIPGWAGLVMELLYSREWPDLTPYKRKSVSGVSEGTQEAEKAIQRPK